MPMTRAGLPSNEATELSSLEIACLIQPESDQPGRVSDDKLALMRTLLVMAIAAGITVLSYVLTLVHG